MQKVKRERKKYVVEINLSSESKKKLKKISINTKMKEQEVVKQILERFLNQKIY